MVDARPTPGADAAPVGDVLRAVGRELADLGRQATELQTLLGALGPGDGREPAVLCRLQTLDALTQSLNGVSEFLDALAPTLPPRWTCDAARAAGTLTLSDLARRLGGGPAPASGLLPAGEAGELELFGA